MLKNALFSHKRNHIKRTTIILKNKKLKDYLHTNFDNVEGWCDRVLFEIFDQLASTEINQKGGFLEIGVHHGKFYFLVNSIIDRKYQSFALDVFDDQSLNIDKSGSGNLQTFKNNLKNFDAHNGKNTQIISGDSTDQTVIKFFDDKIGSFRFISIDGSHTVEHTISDLHLANRLIANEGVVILDDVLNYHWPGVIEGVSYFLKSKPTLIPFAIGYNKLFLVKLSFHSYYLDAASNSHLKSKIVDFFGYKTVAL